jgi:signal transduction histidine kinase
MRQHMATASALRLATAETERAGAAKAEFLAKMSHELRTPLNAVIGYSQILIEDAEDEGDAESIEDLGKILGAGQHLLKLVNEILDLSKIEAGKMEVDLQETVLADLLNEIATEAGPAALKKGNTVLCKIDPKLGNPFCDATKFRNVLMQLVDNAVKFTEDGRIELVAERLTGAASDELVVHVIDTGIGIAPDQISGLFEKFTVVDDSSTSKYGGTGLGLALSQKFCRLMGGDILVQSKIGEGSRFTVRSYSALLWRENRLNRRVEGQAWRRTSSGCSCRGDTGPEFSASGIQSSVNDDYRPCLRSCSWKTMRSIGKCSRAGWSETVLPCAVRATAPRAWRWP